LCTIQQKPIKYFTIWIGDITGLLPHLPAIVESSKKCRQIIVVDEKVNEALKFELTRKYVDHKLIVKLDTDFLAIKTPATLDILKNMYTKYSKEYKILKNMYTKYSKEYKILKNMYTKYSKEYKMQAFGSDILTVYIFLTQQGNLIYHDADVRFDRDSRIIENTLEKPLDHPKFGVIGRKDGNSFAFLTKNAIERKISTNGFENNKIQFNTDLIISDGSILCKQFFMKTLSHSSFIMNLYDTQKWFIPKTPTPKKILYFTTKQALRLEDDTVIKSIDPDLHDPKGEQMTAKRLRKMVTFSALLHPLDHELTSRFAKFYKTHKLTTEPDSSLKYTEIDHKLELRGVKVQGNIEGKNNFVLSFMADR
jgi:hypothetical protein